MTLLFRPALATFAVACSLVWFAPIAGAQSKPTLVVNPFTVAEGVPRSDQWEGNAVRRLESRTIFKLKTSGDKHFDVVTEAPKETNDKVYRLSVKILYWCDTFNACPRLLPGASAGGFSAEGKIHYWLTDQSGNKVFECTDDFTLAWAAPPVYPGVILDDPAADLGVYLSDFAEPFADKISSRLKDAKLF